MPLLADALTDVSTVKEELRSVPAGKEPQLERLINAYSRAIRHYTGRQFKPKQDGDTKSYAYDGEGYLNLEPYEARAITSVTIESAAVAAGEWRAMPFEKTEEGTYLWLALVSPAASLTGVS